MRAQFATIEAITSLMAVLFIVAFISKLTSSLNSEIYSAKINISESAALYDLSNILIHNASAATCINLIKTNSSCLSAFITISEETYGINFRISSQGTTLGNATEGKYFCTEISDNYTCVEASG